MSLEEKLAPINQLSCRNAVANGAFQDDDGYFGIVLHVVVGEQTTPVVLYEEDLKRLTAAVDARKQWRSGRCD